MNTTLINLYNDIVKLYEGRDFFHFGKTVSDAYRKNEITDAEREHLIEVAKVASNAMTEDGYYYSVFDVLDKVKEILDRPNATQAERELKRIMDSKISFDCFVDMAISIVSSGDTPIQNIKEHLINRFPLLNEWLIGVDNNEILFGYFFDDDTPFNEYDLMRTAEELGEGIEFSIFKVNFEVLTNRQY